MLKKNKLRIVDTCQGLPPGPGSVTKKDPDPRTIQPDASQITELCLPEARGTGR